MREFFQLLAKAFRLTRRNILLHRKLDMTEKLVAKTEAHVSQIYGNSRKLRRERMRKKRTYPKRAKV